MWRHGVPLEREGSDQAFEAQNSSRPPFLHTPLSAPRAFDAHLKVAPQS